MTTEPVVWTLWPNDDKPIRSPYGRGERQCWYMAERYLDKIIFFLATEEEMNQPPYFPIEHIKVEYIIQCWEDDDGVDPGWVDEYNATEYHGLVGTSPTEFFDKWTKGNDGCRYRLITRITRSHISEDVVKEKNHAS